MKKLKSYFKGFTLVEFIIVITILAILATIAFVSFQNYVKDARDSNRLATLSNIEKALELYTIKTGNYPQPDFPTTYTGGLEGKTKINQGIIGENVAKVINMNNLPLDPKDGTKYVYSTFGDTHKYYQIAINSENTQMSFLTQTYAFTPFSPIVKGNYKFDPSLPSLIVVKESVTSSGIFDPNVCFVVDGGKNSLESSSGSCIKKDEMSLNEFDTSLVGYWDMETLSGSMLKDLSGNGNDGSFSGGMVYEDALTGGIVGKGLNFNNPNSTSNQKIYVHVFTGSSLILGGTGMTILSSIKYSSLVNLYPRIVEKNGSYLVALGNDGTYINALGNTFYSSIGSVGFYLNNKVFSNTNYFIGTSYLNGMIIFYINGKKIEQRNYPEYSGGYLYMNNEPFLIGNEIGSTRGYNGIIDDVKIYNRALSDEEIAQQAKIAGLYGQ